jgi:hypothetical protein
MASAPNNGVVEASAGGFINGLVADLRLPMSDDGVDVKRVDLDTVSAPAHTLRRH